MSGVPNCLDDGTRMYCVGKLPEHTRVALYTEGIEDGVNTIRALAWFTSEERAEQFRAWLMQFGRREQASE